MRKLFCLGVALLVSAVATSAFAEFTATTTSLGYVSGTFRVNSLTQGGDMKNAVNSTIVEADASSYSNEITGDYYATLVSVDGSGDGTFSYDFGNAIRGVIATNAFAAGGIGPLGLDLMQLFFDATGISTHEGNNNRALEILEVNPQNPDELSVSGSVIKGDVLRIGEGSSFGIEHFIVLTAVPEPGSMAVWALCGLGAVVAGRRRRSVR